MRHDAFEFVTSYKFQVHNVTDKDVERVIYEHSMKFLNVQSWIIQVHLNLRWRLFLSLLCNSSIGLSACFVFHILPILSVFVIHISLSCQRLKCIQFILSFISKWFISIISSKTIRFSFDTIYWNSFFSFCMCHAHYWSFYVLAHTNSNWKRTC